MIDVMFLLTPYLETVKNEFDYSNEEVHFSHFRIQRKIPIGTTPFSSAKHLNSRIFLVKKEIQVLLLIKIQIQVFFQDSRNISCSAGHHSLY